MLSMFRESMRPVVVGIGPHDDERARIVKAVAVLIGLAGVADAVAELVDELPRVGRISFRRLTGGLVERLEVIVRFLAVLELFKQGAVDVEQADWFGDLVIVWTGDGDSVGVGAALSVDDYDG